MRVLFSLLITILALQAQADGTQRHATLLSREGVTINVDFRRVQYANGGSSAVNTFAEWVQIAVVFPVPTGSQECVNKALVEVTLNNWNQGSGQAAIVRQLRTTLVASRAQCTYLATLQFLPIRQGAQGQFTNYRQYLAVRTSNGYLKNPYRNNGEDQAYFEMQLEQVPEL